MSTIESALNLTKYGWVAEPDGRGTWTILSTCLLTIVLCCWTSVCPNIPAPQDGFITQTRDKLHLAIMGVLGPEFLLMLTLGEWSSARASAKGFRELGHHDWSLMHGFYADMGGFVLNGLGIKAPFPVDAQQLLFLVRKGYVQYPALPKEDIADRNKSDGVARCLAVGQASWMVVNCVVRVAQGLALTTLELTTLSFILIFFLTSFCWYHKPSGITTRVTIHLETGTHIDHVLTENGHSPRENWYHTPLDFVHKDVHFCERFWRYYTQIMQRLRLPIYSRQVTTIPWDRIPSDRFLVPDLIAEIIGAPSIVTFGCIFMFAWDFQFPSRAEKILWRIASIYTLSFTFLGGISAQYCQKILFRRWSRRRREDLPTGTGRAEELAEWLRNIHPSRNPQLDIPVRALIPVSLLCALYCIFRGCILVEDIIGLRSLPHSAYQTVDWSVYVPHL